MVADQRENTPQNAEKEDNNSIQIKRLTMDRYGRIKGNTRNAAAIPFNTKTFIVLGWISAAFTAFVNPLFGAPGVLFGMLANRNLKGVGNPVIITNILFAAINIVFGLFLIALVRRMVGY
ncbi:MAG: hypothetical protein N2645_17610 [Clostridia bacterium]|nr:hypothetical protein [Clostridia bacterium]